MEKCEICGQQMSRMSGNHLKKHNLTYKEYIKKFFGTQKNKEKVLAERNKVPEIFDDNIPLLNLSDLPNQKEIPDFKVENDDINVEDLKVKVEEIFGNVNGIENINDPFISKISDVIRRKNVVYVDPRNLTSPDKAELITYLMNIFSDIQNNFFIEKVTLGGFLVYRYVTDICNPTLKIDFEFPNAFWHNEDVPRIVKDPILKRDGWKIINVLSSKPCIEDLEIELKKMKLI
jgi:hypothetical protein